MKKECFICRDSRVEFLLKKNGYDLWHCEKCGLNFVSPQPTDKELRQVYSLAGGYSHSDKGFDKNDLSFKKDPRINFLIKNGAKKVLDVGCASGSFVYSAKIAGLDPIGIDLDNDSIKFGLAEGLDLRHGTLHNMKFKANSFDAINLSQIIEHVKNPGDFLEECLRALKKGGFLIISTPNTNSYFPIMTKWIYEKFGVMWSHPTPPHHLFDFSDKNLMDLLGKEGLGIEKITYSKIPLGYSIYHTGYFDKLRGSMSGTSKGDIFTGLLKSIDLSVFKQAMISFIYGSIFCIDMLFNRKGDWMTIYCIKK